MLRCKTVPYEGKEGYIFISYSHKDSARVFPVIERLDAEGYRVWFDEGIDPGSEWPENVASHLNDSAVYLCFVSENFLASQNCRRELNFALRKEIDFLSVFLEDVTMPLGVEMQITANQAVFKHKIPEEEDFYRKLFAAKTLEAARRAPAPAEEPAAPAEEPAPAPEEKSAPAGPPAPAKKEKPAKEKKAKAPKPAKEKKEKKPLSKKKKALLIVAAVLAGLLLLLIVPGVISAVQANKRQPAAAPAAIYSVDDALVYRNLRCFLYGDRVCEGGDAAAFVSRIGSEDRRTDVTLKDPATGAEAVYNVSVLPFGVSYGPEHKNALLRFYDRVGKEFRVECTPAVNGLDGRITFGAPEAAEYENTLLLSGSLEYELSFSGKDPVLSAPAANQKKTYDCENPVLAGGLSEGREPMREISEIRVPDFTEEAAAEVRFTDGGHAVDAFVYTGSLSGNFVALKWSAEERLYNGALTELPNAGYKSFDFVNTAPWGFIAVADNTLYFYQTPLKNAPEDESAPAEETPAGEQGE